MMSKRFGLILSTLIVVLWATPAMYAQEEHGHEAPHDGMVITVGDYHYEMVVGHDDVSVYLLDEKEQTLPISEVTGSAMFHIPGQKMKTIPLVPHDDHFTATVDLEEVEEFIAIVSLKIEGKTQIGRFTYEEMAEGAHEEKHHEEGGHDEKEEHHEEGGHEKEEHHEEGGHKKETHPH